MAGQDAADRDLLGFRFEVEAWRRRIAAAGPGDLEALKEMAHKFLDGWEGARRAQAAFMRSRLFGGYQPLPGPPGRAPNPPPASP